MTLAAKDSGHELLHDPGRVIARLFRPGDSTPGGTSRTELVLRRVLRASPAQIAAQAATIREAFGDRHPFLEQMLQENAVMVRGCDAPLLSDDVAVVVGASFTAEYAVEGAALCNPSAVVHPDQSALLPGQLRVLMSVRSIGESHLSSIQFCEALVGPGETWTFLPREAPLRLPSVAPGEWSRGHLLRALEHDGRTDELVRSVGQVLPVTVHSDDVEVALQGLAGPLIHHIDARTQIDAIRMTVSSAYVAEFAEDSPISARVLLPVADEERLGMEDARFVEVHDGDTAEYRATYTAYTGSAIASRLITTSDFRTFAIHRLTGPPTRTKGMALFPRRVDGHLLALTRGDGESISISRSDDGLDWGVEEEVYAPEELWDVVQSGNCGPPIETAEGWLVLTHGVGPMRVYSIGVILLDLDDPRRVRATLPGPLIEPRGEDRRGYVPNVVYSCGGLIHDGTLWIPHGVGDDRVRVASVPLADLFAAMTWVWTAVEDTPT